MSIPTLRCDATSQETMDDALQWVDAASGWLTVDEPLIRCLRYDEHDASAATDPTRRHVSVSWKIAERTRSNWEPVFKPPPPQYILRRPATGPSQ